MSNLLWNVFSVFELPHWEAWAEQKGLDAVTSKIDQSTRHLEALFGAYPDGLVEVRIFKPHQEGVIPQGASQQWFPLGSAEWVDPILRYAYDAEAMGQDVYIGVLPRVTRSGKAESVGYCATLWADCDGKTISAQEVKQRGGASADVIVQSGHGLHLYWLGDQVLPLTPSNKRLCQKLLKQKQQMVGSDPVHDFSRVLRLAGTTNWKRADDPKPVRLLKCPSGATADDDARRINLMALTKKQVGAIIDAYHEGINQAKKKRAFCPSIYQPWTAEHKAYWIGVNSVPQENTHHGITQTQAPN